MDRIKTVVSFKFNEQKQLYLAVSVTLNDKTIPLALSSLMSFLYENQDLLNEDDSNFCYSLAKFVKKIQVNDELIYAIPNEYEIAMFFDKLISSNITIYWKNAAKELIPIKTEDTLPITINITQNEYGLCCKMINRTEWIDNPFAGLTFNYRDISIFFSNGTITANLPTNLEDFLAIFLDKEQTLISIDEIEVFLNEIYAPNKKKILWQVQADFDAFLPKDTNPNPYLKLTYEHNILRPELFFQYGSIIIEPNNQEPIIREQSSNIRHKRDPEMENIYQQDLMSLFTEYNLPFMLQSPGDIAEFLNKISPILVKRDWIIESNVPEFQVMKEPVTLEFSIESSGKDWFYFEPNCLVNGQKMSLQEIASLMVQNQGYIKTKAGFAKISDKSQEELKLLGQYGALKVNSKFTKSEIMPLIATTSVQAQDVDVKSLISDIKDINTNTCQPEGFNGELRDYQQIGLNWLHFIYKSGFGGILADDMGLGKTVQVLALTTLIKTEKPFLIICPTNVIYNWEQEIAKFLNKKNVVVYTGQSRNTKQKDAQKANFIITSFGLLKNDIEFFNKFSFEATFVDEAQYIKNPQTQVSKAIKTLNSKLKLAITGTPIENHVQDLWNQFDFVMKGFLGTNKQFDIDIKNEKTSIIKAKIKPFILRRLKTEVLESLPEKTEIIIKCELTEQQELLYQTILDAVKKGIKNMKGQKERLHILTSLLKLRQVCIHPGLLKEFKGQDMPSAKFDFAKEKITELIDENHKVVIFTQFTEMLNIIENWATKEHIYLERIDGAVSGKQRMNAIDRFQTSEKPGIFIISLKAGGVGINLTEADYVIHLDPWWNPAIEAQATDRVHRYGQKNKVIVYKIIAKGTIEEKINELQEQKKALVSEMINTDKLEDQKIDIDSLRKLLI
jgi:superfamily II DNA or RNA helicase